MKSASRVLILNNEEKKIKNHTGDTASTSGESSHAQDLQGYIRSGITQPEQLPIPSRVWKKSVFIAPNNHHNQTFCLFLTKVFGR